MIGRIVAGRDGADDAVAHVGQVVVVGDVARADQLDAGLVEPAVDELLDEQAGLAGRDEHEQRVRIGVARPLQERREVGVGERHLEGLDHLPAGLGEAFGEHRGRLGAGRPVGLHDRRPSCCRSWRPIRR